MASCMKTFLNQQAFRGKLLAVAFHTHNTVAGSHPFITAVAARGYKRWEWPYSRELYYRRQLAGPEDERPRSVWANWNYDIELYSFSQRLSEDITTKTLKKIFTDRSYITTPVETLNVGETNPIEMTEHNDDSSNTEVNMRTQNESETNELLASEGRNFCESFITKYLQSHLPNLPHDGVSTIADFLLSDEKLAHVSRHIGTKDLILCDSFPVPESVLVNTLYAVIGGLLHDQGKDRTTSFVEDFIITQLIGEDLDEIYPIRDAMTKLVSLLEVQGRGEPEPRLLSQSGQGSLLATYQVGIYSDQQLIGQAPGETVTIAEDMAARDVLIKFYGLSENREPLLFGKSKKQYNSLEQCQAQQA